eukprot:122902-Chlamydomonas_euryale.AAC.1
MAKSLNAEKSFPHGEQKSSLGARSATVRHPVWPKACMQRKAFRIRDTENEHKGRGVQRCAIKLPRRCFGRTWKEYKAGGGKTWLGRDSNPRSFELVCPVQDITW